MARSGCDAANSMPSKPLSPDAQIAARWDPAAPITTLTSSMRVSSGGKVPMLRRSEHPHPLRSIMIKREKEHSRRRKRACAGPSQSMTTFDVNPGRYRRSIGPDPITRYASATGPFHAYWTSESARSIAFECGATRPPDATRQTAHRPSDAGDRIAVQAKEVGSARIRGASSKSSRHRSSDRVPKCRSDVPRSHAGSTRQFDWVFHSAVVALVLFSLSASGCGRVSTSAKVALCVWPKTTETCAEVGVLVDHRRVERRGKV